MLTIKDETGLKFDRKEVVLPQLISPDKNGTDSTLNAGAASNPKGERVGNGSQAVRTGGNMKLG